MAFGISYTNKWQICAKAKTKTIARKNYLWFNTATVSLLCSKRCNYKDMAYLKKYSYHENAGKCIMFLQQYLTCLYQACNCMTNIMHSSSLTNDKEKQKSTTTWIYKTAKKYIRFSGETRPFFNRLISAYKTQIENHSKMDKRFYWHVNMLTDWPHIRSAKCESEQFLH